MKICTKLCCQIWEFNRSHCARFQLVLYSCLSIACLVEECYMKPLVPVEWHQIPSCRQIQHCQLCWSLNKQLCPWRSWGRLNTPIRSVLREDFSLISYYKILHEIRLLPSLCLCQSALEIVLNLFGLSVIILHWNSLFQGTRFQQISNV